MQDHDNAKSYCSSKNGSLAIIETSALNHAAFNILQTYTSGTRFHIGLEGGGFAVRTWSSGLSLSYNAWASAADDTSFNQCVVLDTSQSSAVVSWRAVDCNEQAFAVCMTKEGAAVFYRSKYYWFVDTATDYLSAQLDCQSDNGNLVSVIDPNIHTFLASAVDYTGSPSKWWIGLSDRQETGDWRWESGLSFEYEQWEPSKSKSNASYDCAVISKAYEYQWESISDCNGETAPYICESAASTTSTTSTAATTSPTISIIATTNTTTNSTTSTATSTSTIATTNPRTSISATTSSAFQTASATHPTTSAVTGAAVSNGATTVFLTNLTGPSFSIVDTVTKRCLRNDPASSKLSLKVICDENIWVKRIGFENGVFRKDENKCLSVNSTTNELVLQDFVSTSSCAEIILQNGVVSYGNYCLVEDTYTSELGMEGKLCFLPNCSSSVHFFSIVNSPNFLGQWYSVGLNGIPLANSSPIFSNPFSGGATINQLAVFLPKWQAMSVIALLVNGNSSLKSFHLETSLEARHENASTYLKFKFSSIPDIFSMTYLPGQENQYKLAFFSFGLPIYVETLLFMVDEFFSEDSVILFGFHVFLQNVTEDECFMEVKNAGFMGDVNTTSLAETQDQCFAADLPCSGYSRSDSNSSFTVSFADDNFHLNHPSDTAYINQCRDISLYYIVIVSKDGAHNFYPPGSPIYGEWTSDTTLKRVMTTHKVPNSNMVDFIELQACINSSGEVSFPQEFQRLTQSDCSVIGFKTLTKFFVSNSSGTGLMNLYYSERTTAPYDGKITVKELQSSSREPKFMFFVDKFQPIDDDFSSLLVSEGHYTFNASSSQLGHSANHARRGDLWRGWKPDPNDGDAYLHIDIGTTKRLSGIEVTICNESNYIGNFTLHYAYFNQPSQWQHVKTMDSKILFSTNTSKLETSQAVLHVFEKSVPARYLKFVPDLMSFYSDTSGVEPCVKLELFGHSAPTVTSYASVTQLHLTDDDERPVYTITLVYSSPIDHVCLAVSFGDGTYRIFFRGEISETDCQNHFLLPLQRIDSTKINFETNTYINHEYSIIGASYLIEIQYYNGSSIVAFDPQKTVTIPDQYSNVTKINVFYSSSTDTENTLRIYFLFHDPNFLVCSIVDFGNSENKLLLLRNISESSCLSKLSISSYSGDLDIIPGDTEKINVLRTYPRPGVYTIRLDYCNGKNSTSPLSLTFQLNPPSDDEEESSSFIPFCEVVFKSTGRGNLTILRSSVITLSTYFSINCDNATLRTENVQISFSWSVRDCISRNLVESFDDLVGISATFPQNSLGYGCNLVRTTLSMFNGTHTTELYVEKNVNVNPSPLFVEIKGGISKTAYRNQVYQANAEDVSYDPDDPDKSSPLSYTFLFKFSQGGLVYTIGNKSTIGTPSVSLTGSQNGILEFDLLSSQVVDEILVTVVAKGSHERSAQFTQHITLVDILPPDVTIGCVRNCLDEKVDPVMPSVFELVFLKRTSDKINYDWKIETSSDEFIDLSAIDTATRFLEVPAHVINERKHTVTCKVTDTYTTGVAEVSVIVQSASLPSGGRCYVYPTSGRALVTKFTFYCVKWSVRDSTTYDELSYRFYSISAGQETLVTESSFTESTPIFLSNGKKSDDFLVEIKASICRGQRFCSYYWMSLTVEPYLEEGRTASLQVARIAANVLDLSYLGQISQVFLSETAAESDVQSDVSEQILELAEFIIDSSNNTIQTVYDITVLTNVLHQSISSAPELSDKSLHSGSRIVRKIGSSLKQLLNQKDKTLNSENTVTLATSLVKSMSSILNGSDVNTSANIELALQPQFEQYKPQGDDVKDLSPREILYQKEQEAKIQTLLNAEKEVNRLDAVKSVLSGSDDIKFAMTHLKLSVANEVASVGNDNMDISVVTIPPESGGVDTSGRGSKVSFSDSGEERQVEVTSFKQNPFNFDESSLLINSAVTRVTLNLANNSSDNNPTIKLANQNLAGAVNEKIEMKLKVVSKSRFEILSMDSACLVILEPDFNNVNMTVWIRKSVEPVLVDFSDDPDVKVDITDFKFNLPQEGQNDQYKIFLPSKKLKGVGIYFMAVEMKTVGENEHRGKRSLPNNSTDLTNNTTVVGLSVSIFTPSCKVYDETSGIWGGTLCFATPDSTAEETSCVCPTLPSTAVIGSEFFVAPNFIDFSTVFSKIDLISNGAVFFTVTAFLVLYTLIVIWARREDNRDLIKWSTKVMADNDPADSYFYKVTVVTGMNNDGGTLSNVNFILVGEDAQAEARELKDHTDTHWLQSGSVVTFLMSCQDCLGSLDYIHIWHDNSGPGRTGANWFLNDVIVQDMHNKDTYIFPCNQWFAVEIGDGKIDRLLPVAGDDNLTSFKRVFNSTARQKITDEHIWYSIFVTRSRSNFTRCQRLACALVALFLAMIANAMFYEEPSETDENKNVIKVGPIVIDPQTIWISTISALVVLPASIALVQIFRRTDNRKAQKINDLSLFPNAEVTKPARSPGMLPHWFIYVGWALFLVGVVSSGFFTILYSFQWGKEKSERWLSSMMLSVFQDTIVMQPLKVLLIAALFAFICRKRSNVKEAWNDQDDDVIVTSPQSAMDGNLSLPGLNDFDHCLSYEENESQKTIQHPKAPPERSSLRLIRERRKLEKKSIIFFTSFIVHLCYVVILFYIAYVGHQDHNFYRTTSHVRNAFDLEDFEALQSANDLFDYIENSLLPALYPTHKYNGDVKLWRDRIFVSDDVNYRVGPSRLRQLRMKPSACLTDQVLAHYKMRPCVDHYSIFDDDTTSYGPMWIELNRTSSLEADYWKYQDAGASQAIPILAAVNTYGGGGYLADLGVNVVTAKNTVEYLKQHLWLDRSTRALIVEFALYNVNSDLFSTVALVAEFLPSGGIVATPYIKPFRLYSMESSSNLFVASAFVTVLALYYSYGTIKKIFKKRRDFFKKPWNYVAIVRVLLVMSFIGLYILSGDLQETTLEKFQENTYQFTNFQTLADFSVVLRQTIGIILFVETLKILEFFKYLKYMRKFTIVFKCGQKLLLEYAVYFGVTLSAYAIVATCLFSSVLRDYKSLTSTLQTSAGILLGRPSYHEMSETSRVLGKIVFFFFNLHMTYILVNLFVGIIDVLFHESGVETSRKKDGKDAYFRVGIALLLNYLRRLLHMKEKEVTYPKLGSESSDESEAEDYYESDANQSKEEQNLFKKKIKKRKRRRNKRRREQKCPDFFDPDNSACLEVLDDAERMALHRLERLEKAVDSIDVTSGPKGFGHVIKNRKKGIASLKADVSDIVAEVDDIFSGLPEDLMHL
ncbi:uncharacterized protein LOC143462076 isoform X1 [Clavelina lepadiformis]|uniref:uncharacterized protein LOC143462076 isoform X1 n=1 Tax=Clavelina lepadiformis TaxID=159417 RepID=UPI0040427D24